MTNLEQDGDRKEQVGILYKSMLIFTVHWADFSWIVTMATFDVHEVSVLHLLLHLL